jgi:hypothetical protein
MLIYHGIYIYIHIYEIYPIDVNNIVVNNYHMRRLPGQRTFVNVAVMPYSKIIDNPCSKSSKEPEKSDLFDAAMNGSYVPTFRDNLSVSSSRIKESKILENGTDRVSRNVGTELPHNAA